MVETPSIPPSSASSPRVTSASAGAAGVGQQPTTQPAVSIASGSVLSGTVTAADAKGNITLETAAVKLVLQSSVALPRNAQVTVRVEQPVTSDSMPTVRILTVDGKPVSQYIQQAAGQNPQHPGEVARPTAQVIEMSARPTTATQPDAAVQAAVSNRAVAASQLSITAAQTLPAVLLRPMVTARTEEILTKLTQPLLDAAGKPLPQAAPPLTPAMLRPGMQLQVRIMEMPQAMPTGAAPAAPVSAPNAAITPVQPVAAQPIPSQPTGVQTPVNSAQPQQSAGVPTTPNPAQTIVDTVAQKAAYAIYAKQPAVILHPTDSPAKPTVLPAGTPAQTPTPQTPVAQQVAVPSSTPQPQTTQPTVPQPQPMPAPTATTPQATATPTPAQNMSAPTVALSPKVVENLLTTAEGKGLPAG
ncbi:MAG: hypothetical protein FJX23_04245, partial [Alphaproteobacteria bacterium]|nr:hypothetical protein [Alphaproteobacteria bacterium]